MGSEAEKKTAPSPEERYQMALEFLVEQKKEFDALCEELKTGNSKKHKEQKLIQISDRISNVNDQLRQNYFWPLFFANQDKMKEIKEESVAIGKRAKSDLDNLKIKDLVATLGTLSIVLNADSTRLGKEIPITVQNVEITDANLKNAKLFLEFHEAIQDYKKYSSDDLAAKIVTIVTPLFTELKFFTPVS